MCSNWSQKHESDSLKSLIRIGGFNKFFSLCYVKQNLHWWHCFLSNILISKAVMDLHFSLNIENCPGTWHAGHAIWHFVPRPLLASRSELIEGHSSSGWKQHSAASILPAGWKILTAASIWSVCTLHTELENKKH